MEHLEIAKILTDTFKNRTLDHHAGKRSVKVMPTSSQQVVLVFDLTVSQEILLSKAFAGFNYFKPSLERLAQTGTPLSLVDRFYDESVLFMEGEPHHHLKKIFHQRLEKLHAELQVLEPHVRNHIRKHKARILNPLDFSDRVVRLCLALLIARLTSIPLKRVLRTLAMRRNVFFHYFHSSRQKSTNAALAYLYADSKPPALGTLDWCDHLLAQSLMLMGYDPMVSSICASIVERESKEFAADVYRNNPVSYISRRCVQSTSIRDIAFNRGDICYIALLPASDELTGPENKIRLPNLAFGTGIHACIGKQLSLAVLAIAEKILLDNFSDGFPQTSILAPDGAFLSFRNINDN